MAEQTRQVQGLFDQFTGYKREAYSTLGQALTADNSAKGNAESAIVLYKKSIALIDRALAFYQQHAALLSTLDDATRLSQQLAQMRLQSTERLAVLERPAVVLAPSPGPPPDFDQDELLDWADDILGANEQPPPAATPKLVEPKAVAAKTPTTTRTLEPSDFTRATELCRIENAAQMFYIAEDGSVSTPSYPSTLSVYAFDESAATTRGIVGFLRVGTWVYPLVPSESPIMKTNFDAYIFPNEDEEETAAASAEPRIKCTFVGLTLGPNVARTQRELFEDVLSNYGALLHQDHPEEARTKLHVPPQTSTLSTTITDEKRALPQLEETPEARPRLEKSDSADYIASHVLSGSQWLSSGVATTASELSRYMGIGGEKLKGSLTPNAQPVNVSPAVQKTLQGVRYGTHVTVRVSGMLLNKLGSISKSVAKTAAPHLRSGSTALLTKSGIVKDKSAAGGYVTSAVKVAGSGIEGFAIVYDSLENAAKTLGKSFTQETVKVAHHKYGADVGKATESSLYSVGNVAQSVNNIKSLKIVRTLAKETAKETLGAGEAREKRANSDAKNNPQKWSDSSSDQMKKPKE